MSKIETLSEISTINLGRDFRRTVHHEEGGDVLVIQPKEVFTESIDESVFVKQSSLGVFRDRFLQPGDILCSIRHRFVSMVVKEEWLKKAHAVANSGLFVIRLDKTDYLPEYVAAFMNCYFESEEFNRKLIQHQQEQKSKSMEPESLKRKKKENVKILTKDGLLALKVPKVSLDEQRNFAKKVVDAQRDFRVKTDLFNKKIQSIESEYKHETSNYEGQMEGFYKNIIG